jgi:hypothetical protein
LSAQTNTSRSASLTKRYGKQIALLATKTASRMISAVQCTLDPLSGDWPGATMKWAKNRQDQIKRERSKENS